MVDRSLDIRLALINVELGAPDSPVDRASNNKSRDLPFKSCGHSGCDIEPHLTSPIFDRETYGLCESRSYNETQGNCLRR